MLQRTTSAVTTAVVIALIGSLPDPASAVDAKAALEAAGGYTTLLSLIETAGLTAAWLQGAPPPKKPTLFAPVDAAFDALPLGTIEALKKDTAKLTALLEYHLIPSDGATEWDVASLTAASPGNLPTQYNGGVVMEFSVTGGAVTLRPGIAGGDVQVPSPGIASDTSILHGTAAVVFAPGFVLPPPATTPAPPTPSPPTPAPPPTPLPASAATIAANIESTPGLSGFLTILREPTLQGVTWGLLGSGGPFTVFAPTDAAWDAIPRGVKEYLNGDPASMQRVVDTHVVQGNAISVDLLPGRSPVAVLGGRVVRVTKDPVGGSVTLESDRGLSPWGKAIVGASTDSSNGVIHSISGVLIPGSLAIPELDILENLAILSDAGISLELIRTAGLDTAFSEEKGQGKAFTLFPPSDAAWGALPAGQLDALRRDPAILAKVLSYHTLQADAYRRQADLLQGGSTETLLSGSFLAYSVVPREGVLSIRSPTQAVAEGARVGSGDIRATNGIIHVVGRVLFPDGVPIPQATLWDVLKVTPDAQSFVALAELSGEELKAELEKPGPFTAFIPSESAFYSLPSGVLGLLRANSTARGAVVRQCIGLGQAVASELLAASPMRTAAGGNLSLVSVSTQGGSGGRLGIAVAPPNPPPGGGGVADFLKRAAGISRFDIRGGNGVAHLVDSVPFPGHPDLPASLGAVRGPLVALQQRQPLSKFMQALSVTPNLRSYIESLRGPVTLFAPSNAAVDRLGAAWDSIAGDDAQRERVLRHHLVPGYFSAAALTAAAPGVLKTSNDGSVLAGRAGAALQAGGGGEASTVPFAVGGAGGVSLGGGQGVVTDADIATTNGVIHAIDGVLLPADMAPAAVSNASSSLYGIIAATQQLSMLKTAIDATQSLSASLSGEGPYIVFAPSDTAFGKLLVGQRQYILTRADVALQCVQAHVVSGNPVASTTLPAVSPLRSLQGTLVEVTLSASSQGAAPVVMLDAASSVTQGDINGANGVIHIVSDVLRDVTSGWAQTIPSQDLYTVLTSTASVSKFENIINSCGTPCTQVLRLTSTAGVTVFAPVDSAVDMWSDNTYAKALADTAFARDVFFGHTLEGYVVPATFRAALEPGSVERSYLMKTDTTFIVLRDDPTAGMRIADPKADFVTRDIAATNGVLHIIATPLTGSVVQTPAPTQPGSSDDGLFADWWVALLFAIGGVALLLCIVAAVVLCRRKKGKGKGKEDGAEAEAEGGPKGDSQARDNNSSGGSADGGGADAYPVPGGGGGGAAAAPHPYSDVARNPLHDVFPVVQQQQQPAGSLQHTYTIDCESLGDSQLGAAPSASPPIRSHVVRHHTPGVLEYSPAGYTHSPVSLSGVDALTEDDPSHMRRAYGAGPASQLPAGSSVEAHEMRVGIMRHASGYQE